MFTHLAVVLSKHLIVLKLLYLFLKNYLFVMVFPGGCTKFPENPMSFPGSENSLSIPPGFQVFLGLWPPW